jgi:hypothetical protein
MTIKAFWMRRQNPIHAKEAKAVKHYLIKPEQYNMEGVMYQVM